MNLDQLPGVFDLERVRQKYPFAIFVLELPTDWSLLVEAVVSPPTEKLPLRITGAQSRWLHRDGQQTAPLGQKSSAAFALEVEADPTNPLKAYLNLALIQTKVPLALVNKANAMRVDAKWEYQNRLWTVEKIVVFANMASVVPQLQSVEWGLTFRKSKTETARRTLPIDVSLDRLTQQLSALAV